MTVTESYRTFALELLSRAKPGVRHRSMFGGVGIYSGDLFFALIADDTLYFKVDDASRPNFETRGMTPFKPFGPEGEAMQYYAVPQDVLEDPEVLRPWIEGALGVARRKKASGSKRGRSQR